MAVQQNKKSPSKRGMHRSHDSLTSSPLTVDPGTGEVHLRHHISPDGLLPGQKGRQSKRRLNRPAVQGILNLSPSQGRPKIEYHRSCRLHGWRSRPSCDGSCSRRVSPS